MYQEIDPFDIVSGKVVQNQYGTFWFKEPGSNLDKDGYPIHENLYREGGPVIITAINGHVWYEKLYPYMYYYELEGAAILEGQMVKLNSHLDLHRRINNARILARS